MQPRRRFGSSPDFVLSQSTGFRWVPGELTVNSYSQCSLCFGLGYIYLLRRSRPTRPCFCVYRNIFRKVLSKYFECQALQAGIRISGMYLLEREDPLSGFVNSKNPEFCGDVISIAKRTLPPVLLKVFMRFHLAGEPWFQLSSSRIVFHDVYRVEVALGRAFAETLPYPLFPVRDYFLRLLKPTHQAS